MCHATPDERLHFNVRPSSVPEHRDEVSVVDQQQTPGTDVVGQPRQQAIELVDGKVRHRVSQNGDGVVLSCEAEGPEVALQEPCLRATTPGPGASLSNHIGVPVHSNV